MTSFFAAACGLHMHDGALDHALKAQGRLGVHLVDARHLGRIVFDEMAQRLAQLVHIGRAGAQHFGGAGIVQQRKQQVLHRDELVALLARLDKRHMQTDFQFLGDHDFSFYESVVHSKWRRPLTGRHTRLIA